MADLLFPGAHRAAGLGDDGALVAAMLAVEAAWVRVLVEHCAATPEQAASVAAVTSLPVYRVASDAAGNPVL
ncbi:MAG: 3-carboxy-cis,cis-muconate cycloisomerase, partial [Jatrophihabitans sp.]